MAGEAYPLTSINGDVKWNGVQVQHASGWTVNPKNNVQQYATNLTKGKQGRRPGIIDISGTFKVAYNGNAAAVPALPGQINRLQLYDTLTTFWDINNAIIEDISEEVDMETGKLIAYVFKWSFAAKNDAAGGTIVTPNGTTYDVTILGP